MKVAVSGWFQGLAPPESILLTYFTGYPRRHPAYIDHFTGNSSTTASGSESSHRDTRHLFWSVRYWSMGNERLANVAAVARFVRQVIGCNCPDEVFQRVEVRRGSIAVRSCHADYELRIGNRLLVVVSR